jgi:hypothetical protein
VFISCTRGNKRENILRKAQEIEKGWMNLDKEGMHFHTSLKRAIYPWIPGISDTTIPFTPKTFSGKDSLKKIFNASVQELQLQFVKFEKNLVSLKQNYHAFLSWKLLVTNEDIEPSTAGNDLVHYRNTFDSISAIMRKTLRICSAEVNDFNSFIHSVNTKPDTLPNNLP